MSHEGEKIAMECGVSRPVMPVGGKNIPGGSRNVRHDEGNGGRNSIEGQDNGTRATEFTLQEINARLERAGCKPMTVEELARESLP